MNVKLKTRDESTTRAVSGVGCVFRLSFRFTFHLFRATRQRHALGR